MNPQKEEAILEILETITQKLEFFNLHQKLMENNLLALEKRVSALEGSGTPSVMPSRDNSGGTSSRGEQKKT
jgi:hypothetical protein